MSDPRKEFQEELEVTSDYSREFAEQANRFATWACNLADAESEVRRTEEVKDVVWAKLQMLYRKEHSSPKENEVKAYITKHKRYRSTVQEWHQAKYNRDILKAAVEAFKQRKDMLVQLGADARAEQDQTDMTLKKKLRKANKTLREVSKKRKRTRRSE